MKFAVKYFPVSFTILSAVLMTAFACGGRDVSRVTNIDGFGLGTFYSVSVKGDTLPGTRAAIDSVLTAASASMSVFDGNSLLSRLNDNRTDTLDEHIAYCIDLARRVSEQSGGLYDITVLPLVEAYGLGTKRHGNATHEIADIDSVRQYVDYRKIYIDGSRLVKQDPGIRIDLNSIAKGYAVDMVARAIEETGIGDYMVNVGGEVFCRGVNGAGQAWRIGIETPAEGNFAFLGEGISNIVRLPDMGMATSGNYRNYREDGNGRKFTHIINPLTGENTESELLSATVIESSCAYADALATMFVVMGLKEGKRFAEQKGIAVLFIYGGGDGNMHTWISEAMRPYYLE